MRHAVTFLAIGAVVLTCVSGAWAQVVIETVHVGNPGNTGELSGGSAGGYGPDRICGAVDYEYRIGKFEITAGQYRDFLNAVDPAGSNPYGLYNSVMDSNSLGCQITWNAGSSTYDFSGRPSGTEADWVDRPVNYVSWGDAARFANWLHNGQLTGQLTGDPAQDAGLTEDGSYDLNGAMSDGALLLIDRDSDATWVIPSEDEWYKAAYHKNDGVTGNYYDYPTSSDSVPSNNLIDSDPGNNATFYDGGYTIGSPYWRTEWGAHENSESPYGTFDQGGNVFEWNEAVIGSYRGVGGGSFSWYDGSVRLFAAGRDYYYPSGEYDFDFGFRVADVSAECGNGIVEYGEECDDGNENDNDLCLSTCQINRSIPTVSEWGMVTMVLVVLTAGTLVYARRGAAMV